MTTTTEQLWPIKRLVDMAVNPHLYVEFPESSAQVDACQANATADIERRFREQDARLAACVAALEAITHGPSGEAGRYAETPYDMARAVMGEAQRIARAALRRARGETP